MSSTITSYSQVQSLPANLRLNALPFLFPLSLYFISTYRGAVCNVLLTCCKDSVCRLWAETLLPGDNFLSIHHSNHTAGQNSDTTRCGGSSRKNACNGKPQGKCGQEVSHVIVVAKIKALFKNNKNYLILKCIQCFTFIIFKSASLHPL